MWAWNMIWPAAAPLFMINFIASALVAALTAEETFLTACIRAAATSSGISWIFTYGILGITRVWPWLAGLMSRKANVWASS